jgi:hypothetical protein
MNDEISNNEDSQEEPNKKMQSEVCPICKKDPCECPDKNKETESKDDDNQPPKMCWI